VLAAAQAGRERDRVLALVDADALARFAIDHRYVVHAVTLALEPHRDRVTFDDRL
jgi:hypothetical protein